MHTIARYYSTTQRMSNLFRKITTQVPAPRPEPRKSLALGRSELEASQMIVNCRAYVEEGGNLWEQEPRSSFPRRDSSRLRSLLCSRLRDFRIQATCFAASSFASRSTRATSRATTRLATRHRRTLLLPPRTLPPSPSPLHPPHPSPPLTSLSLTPFLHPLPRPSSLVPVPPQLAENPKGKQFDFNENAIFGAPAGFARSRSPRARSQRTATLHPRALRANVQASSSCSRGASRS